MGSDGTTSAVAGPLGATAPDVGRFWVAHPRASQNPPGSVSRPPPRRWWRRSGPPRRGRREPSGSLQWTGLFSPPPESGMLSPSRRVGCYSHAPAGGEPARDEGDDGAEDDGRAVGDGAHEEPLRDALVAPSVAPALRR